MTITKEVRNIQLIIVLLSSSVISSFVTGYFTNRMTNVKLINDQFNKMLDTYIIENNELKVENRRIVQLEEELYKLRQKVLLLESSTQSIPVPMWLKDIDGTMLSVNPAYEHDFLLPRGYTADQYIGENDFAIWDSATANSFLENDQWVIKNRMTWKGIEYVPDGYGKVHELMIIKYPRYTGGVIVGVGGMAIKKSEY